MKTIAFILFSIFYAFPTKAATDLPANILSKLTPIRITANNETVRDEKRILLYFWATWCPDCRDKLRGALPELSKKSPHVRFFAINTDRDAKRAESYLNSEGISLPIYRDETKEVAKNLSVYAVPSWAVLERTAKGEWKIITKAAGSDLDAITKAIASNNP